MTFDTLSTRAQVARLRLTALEALRQYPFDVTALKLLNHGFNTTFGVRTAAGQRFALRLNIHSKRSSQQLVAESAWLEALGRETELNLPVPQCNLEGQLNSRVYSPDLNRKLMATLFSWLPGKDLGDDATPAQMREVGRAAATLHAHALEWRFPEGAALVSLQHPLMDSPNNLSTDTPLLDDEARKVIHTVFARVSAVLRDLFARDTPRALHADLHNGNLKWARGKLYVFDFDDSGVGVPMQDLAIAAYYLRPDQALEAALLEGYQSVAALPVYSSAEYEAIVAGRNLVLLNDMLVVTTAELRAILPRYVHNSITKLRHSLERGVFKHDVAGLVPAR